MGVRGTGAGRTIRLLNNRDSRRGSQSSQGTGTAGKTQQSQPKKVQAHMLLTSQKTLDWNEENDHERGVSCRPDSARIDPPAEQIK